MTTHEYYHNQMNVPFNNDAGATTGGASEEPFDYYENKSVRQRSGTNLSADTLEYHDLPISDQHAHKSTFQRVKDIMGKIFKFTLGNKRLNMYLYTMMKVVTITYMQANRTVHSYEGMPQSDIDFQVVLKVFSYSYMAILLILFTARYIRELISLKTKKPLNKKLNWIEGGIYLTYVLYSVIIALVHFVFLIKAYQRDDHEHDETPTQTLVMELFELFVQLYIVFEKGSHFIHSSHSISLYLSRATYLPFNEVIYNGERLVVQDEGDNYVSKKISKIGVKVLPTRFGDQKI